jgi:hypothetical protein
MPVEVTALIDQQKQERKIKPRAVRKAMNVPR